MKPTPNLRSSILQSSSILPLCLMLAASSCTQEGDGQLAADAGGADSAALGANSPTNLTQGALTVKSAPGKCLSVANMDNGTPIVIAPCNGEATQLWSIVNNTLTLDGKKCVDLTDGVSKDGTKLQIWDCVKASGNQTWQRQGDTFVAGGMWCMDLTDGKTTDGTLVQAWTCAKNNINQSWQFQASAAGSNNQNISVRPDTAGLAAGLEALMGQASESTASTQTPLGSDFAPSLGLVTSASRMDFLARAQRQPLLPTGSYTPKWQSFNVELYPYGSPSPVDAIQGFIGDNSAVAGLASLAYQAPDFIRSIITDNQDGTFAVAMFAPNGTPLTVRVDSQFVVDDDNAMGSVGGYNGLGNRFVPNWASVLEKAAMKYQTAYGFVAHFDDVTAARILPMFTGVGDSFAFAAGKLTPAQMTQAVQGALAQGMFVVAEVTADSMQGRYHFLEGQAYTVMWPGTSAAVMATRNPYGWNPTQVGNPDLFEDTPFDPSNDGILDIALDNPLAGRMTLRIIKPGAAGTAGQTRPFVQPKAPVLRSAVATQKSAGEAPAPTQTRRQMRRKQPAKKDVNAISP